MTALPIKPTYDQVEQVYINAPGNLDDSMLAVFQAGVEAERARAAAETDDLRKAYRIASESADRFREIAEEVLDLDENPGDDQLVAELRAVHGKSGPEPRRWRNFLTGALARLDQVQAMPDADGVQP